MPTRRECANALRALAMDAIELAQSGHPGAPLGMADMAEALWRWRLKFNPANPAWPNRDRFILSNGHASMLLYGLLHLTGFDLSLDEIKRFRQLNSRTPGHPEMRTTPGVEMSTGPLGQGIASAVGFALAESMLASQFNRPGLPIVDHYTYVFCGDGCLMEGISQEACSLAGSWKLGKLIVMYDSNNVSIDGRIEPWFCEDVAQRFRAMDWNVIDPVDGHHSDALDDAIASAQAHADRPSLIICHTHIGFGSPKTDTSASHGAPLGREAVEATRTALGWSYLPFEIPDTIREAWNCAARGAEAQKEWDDLYARYKSQYPDLAKEFERRLAGELPDDWQQICDSLSELVASAPKAEATRVSSRKCLEILVPKMPELVGGSADLSGSTGSRTAASKDFAPADGSGNYLYYGVREFAMAAIMNGLALHGGFIPYAGTFLSFSDQAKNALRLAAMMRLHVIWIFTHDSIGVGEDGPTHQPVEQISTLRLIPHMQVWRPCDQLETAISWMVALETEDAPSCLVLSRQKVQELPDTADRRAGARRGGYILKDSPKEPQVILIATGSEVQLAMAAASLLEEGGVAVRVVSMPCTELFDVQDRIWKDLVLPPQVRARVAIEAGSTDLLWKYAGLDGAVVGIDTFGLSAPADTLFDYFGFRAGRVAEIARDLVARQ